MKFKVNRRQVCHVMVKNNRITNSCGVCLHLTKEKEVQDFFHKLWGDTYICTILKEKRLHTVNHEVAYVQLFLMKYRLILKYNEIQW